MGKVDTYHDILNPIKDDDGKTRRWPKIGILFEHKDCMTGEIFSTPLLSNQIVV